MGSTRIKFTGLAIIKKPSGKKVLFETKE